MIVLIDSIREYMALHLHLGTKASPFCYDEEECIAGMLYRKAMAFSVRSLPYRKVVPDEPSFGPSKWVSLCLISPYGR